MNFREPVTFVRSPTIVKFDSGLIFNSSSPLNVGRFGRDSGSFRGATSRTASAMARMCSGVVPQHPPRRLTKPASARSLTSPPVVSGVSSYSPIALGSPALG